MRKLKDLWVIILDIIAVNASYYLALLIRFYVNSQFRPTVSYLLGDWARFAPFYTVLCIVIFWAFKLYGGMWQYAGLNDMNRIILANVVTTVVQVAGTLIFIRRMPITYYAIGAVLQFVFIVTIRFSYRVLLAEKKKFGQNAKIPAMVVGSGLLGQKVIRHLEENTPYRAVVVAGSSAGRTMDGVPVVSLEDMSQTVTNRKIKAIFIADKDLSSSDLEKVAHAAKDIEVQDFTGSLTNLSGTIPLTALMRAIDGKVTIILEGNEKTYASGHEAMNALREQFDVVSIRGATIELKKHESQLNERWIQEYRAVTGTDISFF